MTPSALAARPTRLGAPEAPRAAVAAGPCGLGTVLARSVEGAARMPREARPDGADPDALAAGIVARRRAEGALVPGFGHPPHEPPHEPVGPRAPRLLAIAAEEGFDGPHGAPMRAVERAVEREVARGGRAPPSTATGAVGAIAPDTGPPPRVVRGPGVMARAIGLVGRTPEGTEDPAALETPRRVEAEVGSS